jgi:hypothetical protein
MLLPRHQNVGQNQDIKIAKQILKMCQSSNIRNDSNKSKFDSGGN